MNGCAAMAAPTAFTGATKNPAGAGFSFTAWQVPQAACSALMRALRRLLWRAALFLWIRPRAL